MKKSGSGSFRIGGDGAPDRGVLCLGGRREATEYSSRWNWTIKKSGADFSLSVKGNHTML